MATEFRVRVGEALADDRVRGNIRKALDGLVVKYGKAFPDKEELESLRDQGQAIRAHALSHLPELLEELERNCTANGIQVHWAETADDANRIVCTTCHNPHAKGVLTDEAGLGAGEQHMWRVPSYAELCTPCHARYD